MSKELCHDTLQAVERATNALAQLGDHVDRGRIGKVAAEFLENVALGAVLKFDVSYSVSKAYADGKEAGFYQGHAQGLNDAKGNDDDDEAEYAGLDEEEEEDDEDEDPHTVTITTVPQLPRPTTLKEFLDKVISATRQQSPS